MEDDLDVLVDQLAVPETNVSSRFLEEMKKRGLWDHTCVDQITVFVPIDAHFDEKKVKCWEETWNLHTARGRINTVLSGVHQICTLAHVVYAMGKDESMHSTSGYHIGGVKIVSFWDMQIGNTTLHGIDAQSLPNIRLAPGEVSKLEANYLSGSAVHLTFTSTGLRKEEKGHTLYIKMTNPDRSELDPDNMKQMVPWNGDGTSAILVVPDVTVKRSAMLWFCMYDNMVKYPLFSTAIPWYITVRPNPARHIDIRVSDMTPKVGKENDDATLFGSGFKPKVPVRVAFGNKSAIVYAVREEYVRCIVPKGEKGTCSVWVAVGNVYTKYDYFTYT